MTREQAKRMQLEILRLEAALSVLRTQVASAGLFDKDMRPVRIGPLLERAREAASDVKDSAQFAHERSNDAVRYARRFEERMRRLELRHRATLARLRKVETKAKPKARGKRAGR